MMFDINSTYGGMFGISSEAAMYTLLKLGQQARDRFNALPKEEQERILKEREEYKERKRFNWSLSQGKCPHCDSKLERGKKDKNNDYKRTWTCKICDQQFTTI